MTIPARPARIGGAGYPNERLNMTLTINGTPVPLGAITLITLLCLAAVCCDLWVPPVSRAVLRLLRPRCNHAWACNCFYQEAEYHCGESVALTGSFKCFCVHCKAGRLASGAIRFDASGGPATVLLLDRHGRVTQSAKVDRKKFRTEG